MKKYIVLLIVLFLCSNKVYAEEICTESLIDIGYNYIDDNSLYKYDTNDSIISYGQWQEYNGEQLDNIEVKTVYKYEKVPSVRYMHIYDSGIGTNRFKISELKIFNNDEEINYEKKCTNCNIDSLIYLDDNNYEYEKQFIMDFRNGHLIIDLLEEYEMKDLKINLYLNDNTVNIKTFYIGFANTKDKSDVVVKEFIHEDFKTNNESKLFEYSVSDKWDFYDAYNIEYESDEVINEDIYLKKIGEYQKYRLLDIKYKTYLINKICNIIEYREVNSVVESNVMAQNLEFMPCDDNKDVETENENKGNENKITIIGTDITKEIINNKIVENKKYQNNIFIIIYIIIIISSIVMLFILKKMSYEK